MVLGSHQFSRHASQRTHGSRTHRLGRRHLACATAHLWHRPIYRQWGIPPRPETAIASVARAGARASMPRVIYGGGNAPLEYQLHPNTSQIPPYMYGWIWESDTLRAGSRCASRSNTFPRSERPISDSRGIGIFRLPFPAVLPFESCGFILLKCGCFGVSFLLVHF